MYLFCQVKTKGRILLMHRPYRLERYATMLKHHTISMSLRKQRFISPCKTTLANSRLLPNAKAVGTYGLLVKRFLPTVN